MSIDLQLQGKIALVTGASRGIGRAAALELSRHGVHILLLGRTQSALESVYDEIINEGGKATGIPIDLTDYDAIDRLGGIIASKWGKLDILIGNAGQLGTISPVSHIKPKDFETTISVNLIANMRLIRAFEPLLLQSDAGRAVFVTSGVAQSSTAFWGGYAASKAGLDTLVRCWANEQKNTNLRINLLSPGAVRTAMRAKAMPGEDPNTLPRAEDIAPIFLQLCADSYKETGKIIRWENSQFKQP